MENVQVRRAEAVDYSAIKNLISLFPENLLQDHLPGWQDFFVAIFDEKIVGCCALEIFFKPNELSPRLAEIRSLAVHKDYQRRGIGQALIAACLERAEKEKVYEVFSFTGAIELFAKFGISSFNGAKYAVFKVVNK